MTSEEIIERLLRQKHISPKEALIILKDLAKIAISKPKETSSIFDDAWKSTPVTCMYGVSTPSYTGGTNLLDIDALFGDDSSNAITASNKSVDNTITTNAYAINSRPIK